MDADRKSKKKPIPAPVYSVARASRVAAKDFTICHNDYFRRIAVGDDLSDVPSIFIQNLITEGVIPNDSPKEE